MTVHARFLLRFRNHGTHPIIEHRRIINEHKECWWGWWKRPYESPNPEFWADIQSAIQNDGYVYIALVNLDETDEGVSEVVFARAIDAIVPTSDPSIECAKVPEADRELKVAPYYDSHAPSYAWLKFSEITKPRTFFKNYSYASAPKLINARRNSLDLLVGKVINNAQELACMNVTMWSVRPKESGDSEKDLVIVFQNNDGPVIPVSRKVIQCDSDYILHISDPHFSVGSNRLKHVWKLESEKLENLPPGVGNTTLADAIISSLSRADIRAGLVVVTGDLTFSAQPQEFEEAIRSIRKILAFLQLEEDRLIVIPGNHDIAWSENRVMVEQEALVVRVAGNDANGAYSNFYEKLLHHEPNEYLSMGRRYVFPVGAVVEICGLNSSCLATGKHFLPGMGFIDQQAFENAITILGWRDRNTAALRILAVHHHLAVTENHEKKEEFVRGYGLAINAVLIQRLAAQAGVHLALHGHKHRAFIWRSTVYELPEERNEVAESSDLSILGAGSAGSIETDRATTYFNLLKLESTKLTAMIYHSISTGIFRKMTTYEAPLQMSQGRLLMDAWRQVLPKTKDHL